jgi:hypothetical protein
MPDDNFDTHEEREAAKRTELFATHKAQGSLGTYCEMYPDEKPILARRPDVELRDHVLGKTSL